MLISISHVTSDAHFLFEKMTYSFPHSITHTLIDPDCCGELSLYYGKSLKEMSLKIREWKYEYLTASYLLLQHRKASGRSIRLAASHAPRAPLGEMRPRAIIHSVADGNNGSLSSTQARQRIAFNNINNNNNKTHNNFVEEKNALNNGAQPCIMAQAGNANSPRAIARNQVHRHSARPSFTPPAIPPKQAPKQQQSTPLSTAPSPLGSKNIPSPAPSKLPPKVAARLPSTRDENAKDEDKENFIVPQGRASRASKTPQANR